MDTHMGGSRKSDGIEVQGGEIHNMFENWMLRHKENRSRKSGVHEAAA